MKIGRLRNRIRFDAEVKTADGAGGNTVTWTAIATVWGEYVLERGKELIAHGHVAPNNLGLVRVRYSSDIAGIVMGNSRVWFDGAPHNIRSITDPDSRKRTLEIVVELVVAPFG